MKTSSRKALAITIFIVLECSCYSPNPYQMEQQENSDAVSRITYAKDSRTGLCLALLGSDSYGSHVNISITTVPCDKMPEVKP